MRYPKADPSRIVVTGHSYGAYIASVVMEDNPNVAGMDF